MLLFTTVVVNNDWLVIILEKLVMLKFTQLS